jgi:hypothetical protein
MSQYINSRLGVEMSADHISTSKSSLLKAGMARKPGPKSKTVPAAAQTTAQGGINLEDIRAVEELAERIGADKVCQLAVVLA